MRGLACLLAAPADPFTRTLELELTAASFTVRLLARGEAVPPCALLLCDLDFGDAEGGEVKLAFTRGMGDGETVLHRPFPMAELRRLIRREEMGAALLPSEDFRTVTVEGESVRLSECEAAILRILCEAEGAVVERRELAAAVFPSAKDPEGSLSVYVHYLRKKLERNGKKHILAHRGGGYSLLSR